MDLVFEIDFQSDEALYTQLCNQIIIGIAKEMVHEGDALPSVRQLADEIPFAGAQLHMERRLPAKDFRPAAFLFLSDLHVLADHKAVKIMYGLVYPRLSS